jgi:hypothetical protein
MTTVYHKDTYYICDLIDMTTYVTTAHAVHTAYHSSTGTPRGLCATRSTAQEKCLSTVVMWKEFTSAWVCRAGLGGLFSPQKELIEHEQIVISMSQSPLCLLVLCTMSFEPIYTVTPITITSYRQENKPVAKLYKSLNKHLQELRV